MISIDKGSTVNQAFFIAVFDIELGNEQLFIPICVKETLVDGTNHKIMNMKEEAQVKNIQLVRYKITFQVVKINVY